MKKLSIWVFIGSAAVLGTISAVVILVYFSLEKIVN